MSNGRTHDVRHPELAIVGQDTIAIGVESEQQEFPAIRLASISHVNEVERIANDSPA